MTSVLSYKKHTEKELLERACEMLKQGGLAIVPSDTVYGLSADASSQKAVEKLIEFKERPRGKAISVFVGDLENAKKYVSLNQQQEATIKALTPGPYTFAVPSKHVLELSLESEKGTLGIRMPDFAFITQLVKVYGKPITATSANLASQSPHYSVESLLKSLSEKKKNLIDLIIDFGPLPRNKPSTVADLTEESLKILRQGDSAIESKKLSHSEAETKKIAKDFLSKLLGKKPAVIILKGDLGAGKTIFVKGLGEGLGIHNIISPTYIVCYEYKTNHPVFKKLHHCDFYILSENRELEHLGIPQMLEKNNLLCIEWGEKSADMIDLFKEKAETYIVTINHIDENTREVIISHL